MIGYWRKAKAEGRDRTALCGPGLGSVVLASLLFCEVASAMVGAEAVFFSTLLVAWLVLPIIVGPRNVLDAGGGFMLVSLGVVVIVSLAS